MLNANLFGIFHFVFHKILLIRRLKIAFDQKAKTFLLKKYYICKIEKPLV